MKKIRKSLIIMISMMMVFGLAACGKFDAKGYTQALLDQMFQGTTKELASFDKDADETELEKQYKEYIKVFSSGLTEGLNISEEMAEKYNRICKEIFRTQKYSVVGEEKIDQDEYQVTVEIQPSDVFVKWKESLNTGVENMQQKVERGEYQGTEEEILAQLEEDIIVESYEQLEQSYKSAQYGEKENIVLTIKKGESEKFQAEDEEISQLITKILRLDEILD